MTNKKDLEQVKNQSFVDKIKNKTEEDEESDDQRFFGNLKYEEEVKAELDAAFNNLLPEVSEVVNQLKEAQNNKGILPDVKKRRDLDVETGGLEEGIKGTTDVKEVEQAIKDVWDGRSEEVDKMAVNVFETTGMRSFVDRKKKLRLAAMKLAKDLKNPQSTNKEEKGETTEPKKMSFLQRISLRKDLSHEKDFSR